MKLRTVWLMVMAIMLVTCCYAQGRLLKRVREQANVVEVAYAETWKTFYGDEHYKTLMNAALDVRPDGTPNIVLNEANSSIEVVIRLSVNEKNYDAWKSAAHKRFKDANMSYTFSDFEDPKGRMIGGKNYVFGANEENAIESWERENSIATKQELAKMALVVDVRLLDAKGKCVCNKYVPLKEFSRLGFATFPIPLHNLNRLRELPRKRFPWFSSDEEPKADSNIEDGYAKVLFYLQKEHLDTLEEVKCEVMCKNEYDVIAAKELAEREARERAEREAAVRAERETREKLTAAAVCGYCKKKTPLANGMRIGVCGAAVNA